jgi:hypothetical protein
MQQGRRFFGAFGVMCMALAGLAVGVAACCVPKTGGHHPTDESGTEAARAKDADQGADGAADGTGSGGPAEAEKVGVAPKDTVEEAGKEAGKDSGKAPDGPTVPESVKSELAYPATFEIASSASVDDEGNFQVPVTLLFRDGVSVAGVSFVLTFPDDTVEYVSSSKDAIGGIRKDLIATVREEGKVFVILFGVNKDVIPYGTRLLFNFRLKDAKVAAPVASLTFGMENANSASPEAGRLASGPSGGVVVLKR